MNPSDSGESSEPAAHDAEAEANRLKADGNTAFKRKDYASAIDAYSQAIALTPDSHLLYSNRSAAYLITKVQMTPRVNVLSLGIGAIAGMGFSNP